ncbi:MAG: hypothetical protein ACMUEL_06710 [Flavobacteriales bacterium Tduv]
MIYKYFKILLPCNVLVSYFHSRSIKDHIKKKNYRNSFLRKDSYIIQQISE